MLTTSQDTEWGYEGFAPTTEVAFPAPPFATDEFAREQSVAYFAQAPWAVGLFYKIDLGDGTWAEYEYLRDGTRRLATC